MTFAYFMAVYTIKFIGINNPVINDYSTVTAVYAIKFIDINNYERRHHQPLGAVYAIKFIDINNLYSPNTYKSYK